MLLCEQQLQLPLVLDWLALQLLLVLSVLLLLVLSVLLLLVLSVLLCVQQLQLPGALLCR